MMKESFDMAKKANADYILFPILIPLPGTEMKEMCEKENLIEKSKYENFHDMYSKPVARTKYATREQVRKFSQKIRNYQVKKYIVEGLKMKGLIFLWDLFKFLTYYKPKYNLEMDHAFRFTINKYKLNSLSSNS